MIKEFSDINTRRFNSKFTRNRAVLSADHKFCLGIDLLGESLEKTCEYFKIDSFKDLFVSFVEELFVSPKAYSDAYFILEELKKKYKVGLLTNADNYILTKSILKQGFDFDFVFTSEDAQSNKPDSEIFRYALKNLRKTPEKLIMIGDSQIDDIYGASKVNIKSIWINRNNEELKDGIQPPMYELNNLYDILNKI